MRRRFLPAPEYERCWAVVTQAGTIAARCPFRRVDSSNLCGRHRQMEAEGRTVRRVQRPTGEACS